MAFIFLVSAIVKLNESTLSIPFNGADYAQSLVTTTAIVTLTIIQGLFLIEVLRDADSRMTAWHKSVIYRCTFALRDSFVSRSVGFHLFWTLGVFFASGFGIMMVLSYHAAIVLYVPLLLIVTLPTLIAVCRRAGTSTVL